MPLPQASLQVVDAFFSDAQQMTGEAIRRYEQHEENGVSGHSVKAKRELQRYAKFLDQAKTLIANNPIPSEVEQAFNRIRSYRAVVTPIMAEVGVTHPENDPTQYDVTHPLPAALDRLNSKWKQAEKALTALHTPVEKFCVVWCDDSLQSKTNHCIAWMKIGREWRICYGRYESPREGPNNADWIPVTDCSADIRVRLVEGFGKLTTMVKEESRNYLEKVLQAGDALDALLRNI